VSIKDELAHYIRVQEEPFGDPSIIAHGTLMNMAANAGIKVILNGQGADEVFFGYNNMAQAILMQQFKALKFGKYFKSLNQMKLGKRYMIRTIIQVILPKIEKELRINSRSNRRSHIVDSLLSKVDERSIKLATYDDIYDVWKESIYGVHLPHLVHYDDRNGMSRSLEGRMPFLDHRIAEFVATLQPESFLKSGLRKYILRETCKEYLPVELYKRTDKVGFFTPLIDMLVKDKVWVADQMASVDFIKEHDKQKFLQHLKDEKMDVDSSSTKGDLKRAFMKMQKSKNVNRVLLNRFVEKIA
jgi:asparagine synthase (glutamine-hydrolysing)